MSNIFFFPYKAGSKSVVALKQLVNGKIIKLQGSKFKPGANKLLVNWGSTDVPYSVPMLNPPALVQNASNKKKFFQMVDAAPEELRPRIPGWTTDKKVAAEWLKEEKAPLLFGRLSLAGHSGEGIVKVSTAEELAALPEGTLIVRYVPKRHEFRLHVTKTKGVISKQQKKRSTEVPDDKVDFQVRNLANGFIFARNELTIPDDVTVQAVKALKVSGLDFGAVDVIYNQLQNQAYVLEINTAPGLTGTTAEDYAKYLQSMAEEK